MSVAVDRIGRWYTVWLTVAAVLCGSLCAEAVQTPSLNLRHYTIEDGMSVNAVYCITQDSKGFMWFGTIDGLNRFDGRNIRQFKPSPEETGIHLGNVIYALCEDRQQRLWIGSDDGLALFNLVTEQFEAFDVQSDRGVRITKNVTSLCADADNNLWIGTNGQGLFVYHCPSGRMTQFEHDASDPETICSNNIMRICRDSRGGMWFTSLDNGVCVLETGAQRFRCYALTLPGVKTRSEAIYEDLQGNIWVGNNDKGLINLDRQSGEIRCYLDHNSPDFVHYIRSIVEYSPGILLLASDDGLTFFDVREKRATTISSSHTDDNGLNDTYLHALFIDREKGLWIGTYFGGVNYLSSTNVNFVSYSKTGSKNSLPGKIVSAFCEDPDGNLWIGTDDAGISLFDTRRHTFTNYKPEKGRNSLAYHNIHALEYVDGQLWIGMFMGGLDRMDIRTGRFKNYRSSAAENSLCSSSIYAICRDRRDHIWIGTPMGLNRYNASRDDFERIEELRGCDISSIIEDGKGSLWVGTLGEGIFRLDLRTGVWKSFPVSRSVLAGKVSTISIDERDRLWIGTAGEGLFRFDYDREVVVPCENTGLPSYVIHKIIPDHGFLWVSTNRGVVKFNPENETFRLYNHYDGLPSDQFSPNAGIKTRGGKLFFGGINGFTCFTPGELQENKLPPVVAFTNLQIWNREMLSRRSGDALGEGNLTPLNKSISYTDQLVLSHSQSTFSIEFVALSFTAPLKNSYMYRLEGLDTQWSTIDGEPRLSYMNLPPGRYRLLVKASNGDDVWTQEPTKLDIVIRPPLWRSTAAYIFYWLLFMSSAVYLYYYLLRRTKRRHEAELLRLENSKEKDIYNAKVNFFTNIVHEIRTPLSLIIAPLDIIIKSEGSISSVREELGIISRNSNRLLKLVNQLMDFRKIESDGFLLKFENHDLVALTEQICAHFGSVENQRIEISYLFPDVRCVVCVDAEAVEKVVSNLFFNAVKFTRDRIVVEITPPLVDVGVVELRIKDNGPGISEEEIDKIFQPFYQVKENQHADTPGTGIGLTLAHTLTKALGGKLIVHSRLGSGSEFVMQLPVVASDCVDEISEVRGDDGNTENECFDDDPQPGEQNDKLTLMVVDDNEELCRFLQKQLQESYSVIVCNNALTALEILKEDHVDLIVCDVMMPQMDGFEFTQIVKNQLETSHIPILLLTAKANVDAKIEGLESGADVYIEKPFSVEFLVAQINSLIANRDRLRQRFINMPFVSSQTIVSGKYNLELLKKMDDVIEKNISASEFTINDLAGELCMSRAKLFEKVKNVSGLTPNNYIQLKRLKQAAMYIHSGEYQISEVCYLVGFTSASYFTKCFKRQFGVLPTEIGKLKS